MKHTTRALGLAVFLFGFAVSAHASTFDAAEHYTLPSDQHLTSNLYAAGNDVSILGTVMGDTLLAGSKVLVNGAVGGDVFAAGNTVDVLSPINGDVRTAGSVVTIGNTINGDVVVFAGTVHLLAGSVVKGDIMALGGTILIDGPVEGNVRIHGGIVTLNSAIKGNVDLQGSQSVAMGGAATIGGYLHYSAPQALSVRQGAVTGEVKYTATDAPKKGGLALLGVLLGVFFLIMLGGQAIASVVAVLAFPKCSNEVATRSVIHFGSSLLMGFAVLILVPILSILLMISLVGLLPGIFLLLSYIALLIVAKIYAGILVGAFLSNWWKKEIRTTWKWALLGTFIIALITVLPILGGLVAFLFFLSALGSLSAKGYDWWKMRNSSEIEAEVIS